MPDDPRAGHCDEQAAGVGGAANYCVALFTLINKIGLTGYTKSDVPAGMLSTVTATELADGDLIAERLHGPAQRQPVDPGGRRRHGAAGVRQPGRRLRRHAGERHDRRPQRRDHDAQHRGGDDVLAGAEHHVDAGLDVHGDLQPTASPAAWGFDDGGFIYRDSSGNPIYDPGTMNGNGSTIPPATAAVSYADPLKSLGFSRNATGPGKLDGRPDVVDQPFGSGRAIMIGHDAFYRSWKEVDERVVLNALLYPTTAALPPADGRSGAEGGGSGRAGERAGRGGEAAGGQVAAGAQEPRRRP